MAETPKKGVHSPRRSKQLPQSATKPSLSLASLTPQTSTPSRSTRRTSLNFDSETPRKPIDFIEKAIGDSVKDTPRNEKTSKRKSGRILKTPNWKDSAKKDKKFNRKEEKCLVDDKVSFFPVSPEQLKSRKRKRDRGRTVVTRAMASKGKSSEKEKKSGTVSKRRVHYKKVMYDGGEFEVGDDVYVKRREDASSDDEDPEVEECRVCFKSGKAVMIECDDCLGGFHLKCLKPPLKEVPEGDWIFGFCEAHKLGKKVQLPLPPKEKKLVRTMREKLLSSYLWAARIESIWKEVDGSYWCTVRWYMIPEETASGRQPHNLKRELYRTNDFADIEMECVLRHCFVKNPKEYAKASEEGDDVFLCEYEYDIHWHSFKRLAEINDDEEDAEEPDCDEDWKVGKDADSDTDDEMYNEEESIQNIPAKSYSAHELAANSRKGRFFGLERWG